VSTKYPSQIDTNAEIPLSTDLITQIKSDVTNTLRGAILATEAELGIRPSGTFGTVRARLDALEALLRVITGDVINLVPTLREVLNQGNTTDGINILLNSNSDLVLSSGSSIRSTTSTVNINDGLNVIGPLNVNSNLISGVLTPVSGTDAANKTYVDSITAAGSAGGDLTGTYPNPTVGTNKITFAKFQQIATDSLLGRDSVGTGDVENITLNATLSMTGSGALQRAALTGDVIATAGSNSTTVTDLTISGESQGSVLYFNGTNWVQLAQSTDGYVLTTHSTGQNPTYTTNHKLTVTTIGTSTITLNTSHAGCYLRFTNASGCVVTVNSSVFSTGDWVILFAANSNPVSFAGTATITVPTTKVATSAEFGATMALIFSSASAADLSGELSDA